MNIVKISTMIGEVEMSTVIEKIIDQADRNDRNNIQFEQDIIFGINRAYDMLVSCVTNEATSCSTMLIFQKMMNKIENIYNKYVNSVDDFLIKKLRTYADKAYDDMGDLIQMGKEISGNLSENMQEQRKVIYSDEAIDAIREETFTKIKGLTNKQIMEMRGEILKLVVSGTATKSNVRDVIQKVLDTDKSYAEMLAQTELSTVYNLGTTRRLKEYKKVSGHNIKKYWHGFKYSERTCEYCRERIGGIYDLDDESETLPAHPRCRCIWLPYDEDWDSSARNLMTRANMLNTAYSPEMIYDRINTRLGIDYGKYMSQENATDYLVGDRSTKVIDGLRDARSRYIKDLSDSFDINMDTSNGTMSKEFNEQMKFWKNYVATNIADKNQDVLSNCIEAIKGVMTLPWTANQMEEWSKLLSVIIK